MSPYPHKGTCLWYKWLTMGGTEQWEGREWEGKKRAKLCQNGCTRGRARGRWILFDCRKAPLGKQSFATTALLNPGHAIRMRHRGTKPLQHSAIWRYEKAGMGGRESATPPLSALWQIVDAGWGNSQQAKDKSTTGSWQWGEFEGAQNRVPCFSWDVIMPRSLQTQGVLYPPWPASWADSLMMLPIIGVRLGLGLRG